MSVRLTDAPGRHGYEIGQRFSRRSGTTGPALRAAFATDVATSDVSTYDAGADAAHPPDITRTMMGAPAWEPVGLQQFTASCGSAATMFAPALSTLRTMLAPNHTFLRVDGLFGPGTPHAPPYADEIPNAVSAQGFVHSDTFSAAEFSAPNCVFTVMVIAPTASAPAGSAPDFASGPILPRSIFPFHLDTNVYKNGSLWDPTGDSDYPSLDHLSTHPTTDGGSHVVLIWYESMEAAPAGDTNPAGSYQGEFILLDSNHAGYRSW